MDTVFVDQLDAISNETDLAEEGEIVTLGGEKEMKFQQREMKDSLDTPSTAEHNRSCRDVLPSDNPTASVIVH